MTRNAPYRKLDRKPGRSSTSSRSISRAGVHAPRGGLPFSSWRAQSSESAAVDEYPGGVSIQPSTSSPRRLRTRAQTTERLRTGDRVTVDGGAGSVRVHLRQSAAGYLSRGSPIEAEAAQHHLRAPRLGLWTGREAAGQNRPNGGQRGTRDRRKRQV
jgi:hypothetical protein